MGQLPGLLRVRARAEENDEISRCGFGIDLRPRRPQGGGQGDGADTALGRPEQACEEILTLPATLRRRGPVDRRGRVGLDDVEAAVDENGGGSRRQRARRKSLLRDRAPHELPAAVERGKPQEGLRGSPLYGVGDRRPAASVQSKTCRSVAAAGSSPGDRRHAAAASKRDPTALWLLSEDADVAVWPLPDRDPRQVRARPRERAEPHQMPVALPVSNRDEQHSSDRPRHVRGAVGRHGEHTAIRAARQARPGQGRQAPGPLPGQSVLT